MAIKFEDAPVPKGKPVEKARPAVREVKPAPEPAAEKPAAPRKKIATRAKPAKG